MRDVSTGPDDGQSDGEPGGPFGAGGFGDLGFFLQDLSRMLAGGTGSSWEGAAQLAGSIASQGRPESNVDPADRLAVEQLARVAELQVQEVTGRPFDEPLRLEALNRTQWARRFLDDHRTLLERLSGSLGRALQAQLGELEREMDEEPGDLGLPGMPPDALIRQVMGLLGPMLLGMMAGSTAGHLAARALGHYELPLTRPSAGPLTLVLSNVDEFADSWSLPRESIRLWVCLSDAAHHQVLHIPHVRARLQQLSEAYASGFNDDAADMERRMLDLGVGDLLGSGEPDMAALQRLAGNPDVLLGAMRSDEQTDLMVRLEALVATIEGYVDFVLDSIGARLLPEYGQVTEALRRRRVTFGPEGRFVEQLFGLELSQATFDRGAAFVDGVRERAGVDAVHALWADEEHLPTPAELDAPGLWLARVGIEVDAEADLDFDGEFEIPDFLPDDGFGDDGPRTEG